MVKHDLMGKHVKWNKIKSKPNASMRETRGFGTLTRLDKWMTIEGDYGVTTSMVKSVENVDGALTVVTNNSTYVVKAR